MTIDRRIIDGDLQTDDEENYSLRPSTLDEFIGQRKIAENLKVFVRAACSRNEALDHVLLYGPPGLGKTTIAQIVAKEMAVNFRSTSGPILSKAGDLAAIITNLDKNDVLFIDEIHRLNPAVEEILYSAMEDFSLDIIIGEGPSARTVKIDLPQFTLVGATTRIGLLSNPLRDRFGIPLRLNFYSPEELSMVIKRAAEILKVKFTDGGADEVAKRSRGTPRIAIRLLKRVRDFVCISGVTTIGRESASEALQKLEVDSRGLDSNDNRYLKFIIDNYAGGPVGVETICAGLSEARDTIEETVEPYLIQQGLVQRTPRGRLLTKYAFEHLCINLPNTLPINQLPLESDDGKL